MKITNEQLATALKEAKEVGKDGIIKSTDISTRTRSILLESNYLTKIIRGWYLLTTQEGSGTTTAWYASYWMFINKYMNDRFGEDGYCVSVISSLDYHTGDTTIPQQLVILTNKPSNTKIDLLFGGSILLYTDAASIPPEKVKYNQVNIMPLEYAIVKCPQNYFLQKPDNIEIALKRIQSADLISKILIDKRLDSAADRIIGAFQFLGENKLAADISQNLKLAGFKITPLNPFQNYTPALFIKKIISPYALRIESMWNRMREDVINNFPALTINNDIIDLEKINSQIENIAEQDAYHSLSIEGYRVSDDLIKRIQSGEWDANNTQDKADLTALAAKGYNQAFKEVKSSIARVFQGINPGTVFKEDLSKWYTELFKPHADAGLINIGDLLGYRNNPVYIKNAHHVPPPANAILDSMSTLFELIENEGNVAVRSILGHYFFVFIHPYMDGNGRIARFLMNLMLITGGYNWTIINISNRSKYMHALDLVVIDRDIISFTKFIADELLYWQHYENKI